MEHIIYESEIQDFFFTHLTASGVAASDADLKIISNIVFEYLISLGVLEPANIYIDDDEDEE